MAKILSDSGINPMHPTTIAKIEAGDRSVRINEAVGIATVFRVSLDRLLSRRASGAQLNDVAYTLRVLRGTARQSTQQVWATAESLREQLEDMPRGFEGRDALLEHADETWNRLISAFEALVDLVDVSTRILERERATPRTLAESQ
jgi:transcriptional regulator with XRE-family HTH domain